MEKSQNKTNIISFLIAAGLLAVAVTWIIGFIQDYNLNKQFEELMVQELENNLKIVNDNIWELEESGNDLDEIYHYDFYDKAYDSLFASNKIVIFSHEEIQQLFYLHNAIDKFRKIVIGQANPEFRGQYYYNSTLISIKIQIKYLLKSLGKEELYENLKLRGVLNVLSEPYIEDNQTQNNKINKVINKPMTQYIFLSIVLVMAGAILFVCRNKNAWDVMFFNTTLAIVALFMIGLLDSSVWGTVVWALGLVATGTGVAGIFRVRAFK